MSVNIPEDLHYSADHEWVNDDSPARVGITAVATDALGDVVFVDLPEVGDEVSAGEACGEVESTKSVSDIISPVSGVVKEVNEALEDDPALVNQDPYGEGWMFAVEVSEKGELLTAEEYKNLES